MVLLLFFLHLSDSLKLPKPKKNKKQEAVKEILNKDSGTKIHREYIDPKTLAERIFKNVMLKRSLTSFGEKILQNLGQEFESMQGIFYILQEKDLFSPVAYYAISEKDKISSFQSGEGINGQAVIDEKVTILTDLPDSYRLVLSGLGQSHPGYLYFVPFFIENKCIALIEFSTFREISESRLNILNYLIQLGAKKLNQFREKINE